eukprot:UN26996
MKILFIIISIFTILLKSDNNYVFAPIPQTEGQPEKIAIFIPGGGVPVGYYNETVRTIQQHTSVKLWVGVPNFATTLNLCDPLDPTSNGLQKRVKQTLDQINKQSGKDWQPKDTYFLDIV